MTHITADRVKETTTTTGSGAVTLAGAPSGFQAFSDVMAASDTCFYAIVGGAEWEVGVGTFNTTLERTTVLSSSNAGGLVTFSAGAKEVAITVPAEFLAQFSPENALAYPAVSAEPLAPPPGILLAYSKALAGRLMPKIIGPAGMDTTMQVGLHGNAVALVSPANGTTAPSQTGITLSSSGTLSSQITIASGNRFQATWRKRYASAGTAGSVAGSRTAYTQYWRGNTAGNGGVWFRTQVGQNINLNGAQCFIGLVGSTSVLATSAGAVSNLPNSIGIGYDTTDSSAGNWFLYRNDGTGSATKVDLGSDAARNTTHGFDLIIFIPPGNATEVFVSVVNVHTGVVVLDTSYTTDIPSVNTGLAYKAEVNNGAVASAVNIEIAKVYIETDY